MIQPPQKAANRAPTDGESLAALDRHTVAGALYTREAGGLRCVACAHRCKLQPGQRGVCQLRFNEEDKLKVPFGYIAGLQCDPVEKKPFFHFYPGASVLTFGMLGCNFHCDFCQNWSTSQTRRDPAATVSVRPITPEDICALARARGSRAVVSSYNEPLITAEWGAEIFRAARAAGLACAMVSNGQATMEAMDYLRPHLSALKVDLKCFDPIKYRRLGGQFEAVTETIREAWRRGIWLEIVTLLIPGFNDAEAELRALTEFIAAVNPDIPWHVTAFHPDYRRTDGRATRATELIRAARIGKQAGLRYIYAGNLPGKTHGLENTDCPRCGTVLIEREGFDLLSRRLSPDGHCPNCNETIPGRWA
jgi:pyruvate formate lyase activating enzyme